MPWAWLTKVATRLRKRQRWSVVVTTAHRSAAVTEDTSGLPALLASESVQRLLRPGALVKAIRLR